MNKAIISKSNEAYLQDMLFFFKYQTHERNFYNRSANWKKWEDMQNTITFPNRKSLDISRLWYTDDLAQFRIWYYQNFTTNTWKPAAVSTHISDHNTKIHIDNAIGVVDLVFNKPEADYQNLIGIEAQDQIELMCQFLGGVSLERPNSRVITLPKLTIPLYLFTNSILNKRETLNQHDLLSRFPQFTDLLTLAPNQFDTFKFKLKLEHTTIAVNRIW